jgi:RHS repeat-associated protein
LERYEYDAYGKVTITGRGADGVWYTADDITLTNSAYNNLFTFTGRQLDTLGAGALHHMHYRHRDYSPQLGRFLQHDPLGVVPVLVKRASGSRKSNKTTAIAH